MNIAIDIDNTITETTEYFYNLAIEYNEKYIHRNCKLDDTKTVPRSNEWTKEELKYYMDNIYFPNIKNVTFRKDAIKYINQLREDGNKIIIITKKGYYDWDNSDKITEEYFNENGLQFDKLITKAVSKYQYFEEYNIDFFIDDSIKECEDANARYLMK